MVLQDKKVTHNVKLHATRVESVDAERVLWARRGVTLCNAQGAILCKKKADWRTLEIPAEAAMPCVTQVRITTAKTPTQKVPVSKEGGVRLRAMSEGRLSLSDKHGKAKTNVRIPKVHFLQRARSFA